ncbi:MAG: hypothetical protein ABW120_03645 [Sedimenticola sp.]
MLETILGLGAGALALFLLIWLLPIILILKSDKTSGGEKLLWLLAVLFISWFAWIFYLLLAPIGSKE